ncbi:hypothetical protein [Endozoicomonas euniceicola]|uniref:Uncharacterized protein n=1 Tax=Endozoicomonas euniceicola TaxID=1234143 RepID=A0ABY6GRX7_9GAMM|nr:hypothetical protein [Endozoicomonas euniceicola]UYM15505.1 hypothetical protein NX720_22085 [Endozoicomonas euniceicola]
MCLTGLAAPTLNILPNVHVSRTLNLSAMGIDAVDYDPDDLDRDLDSLG